MRSTCCWARTSPPGTNSRHASGPANRVATPSSRRSLRPVADRRCRRGADSCRGRRRGYASTAKRPGEAVLGRCAWRSVCVRPQEVGMNLSFVYMPVDDITKALRLYRNTRGFEEAWREGDLTVGLKLPGTDVVLMLDQDTPGPEKPGPFFRVESVDDFYRSHQDKL